MGWLSAVRLAVLSLLMLYEMRKYDEVSMSPIFLLMTIAYDVSPGNLFCKIFVYLFLSFSP